MEKFKPIPELSITTRNIQNCSYVEQSKLKKVIEAVCPALVDGQRHSENALLYPFFTYFYYLGIIPFRIKFDKGKDQYFLKTCRPQQVLCAVVHLIILSLICYMVACCFKEMKDKGTTIVSVFDLASNVATCISSVLILYTLWWRRDQLRDLVECTRLKDRKSNTRLGRTSIYMGLIASTLCATTLAWYTLHDSGHYLTNAVFGDSELNPFRITTSDNKNSQLLAKVWNLAFHIIILPGAWLYGIHETIFLIVTISLRQVGNEFKMDLERASSAGHNGNDTVKSGIIIYEKIKHVTDSTRDAFGTYFLACYISCICYFAEAPYIILGKRGNAERALFLYFAINNVVYIVAAEFHLQIRKTVMKWMDFYMNEDNLKIDCRLKLLTLANGISLDPVAIHMKYFPLTYQNIGAMMSLVVTYGIIVFQLQQDNCSGGFL